MDSYAQRQFGPRPGEARSRTSSAASKYIPEGYPTQPSTQNTDHTGHLVPAQQHAFSPQSSGPFTPSNPEQYQPSTAAFSGAVPPAQLPLYYQDNRLMTPDGHDRAGAGHRPGSSASHHSERSVRSSHSPRRSHDGYRHHDGGSGHEHHEHHDHHEHHNHHEHGHDDENDDHRHSSHTKKHFDDDNERHLKRTKTQPRSFGGSLFGVYDLIKDAIQGK